MFRFATSLVPTTGLSLPTVFCRLASKKAGGQAKNGRTSNPKSRGFKKGNWEKVNFNDILVTQKGTKVHPGENTHMGRNFTIHASTDGYMLVTSRLIYNNPGHKPSTRWRTWINVVKERPPGSIPNLDIR
eukprot:TRINITY_DN51_c0_g1_i1.p1 TRINITY_DN51_c0_g1~~TRINITY_DN51_c0_g1_i1.p1  ORF type:complete len:130 (-),score=21.35 TRINITY_DN51_c0_g1_i1:83-472(-)